MERGFFGILFFNSRNMRALYSLKSDVKGRISGMFIISFKNKKYPFKK